MNIQNARSKNKDKSTGSLI